MNPVDLFLIAATTATAAGYVCRMDALKLGTHRALILAIHVGFAVITLLAVNEAFTGAQLQTLQDVAVWSGWAMAAAWLLLTFEDYRHAPPPSAHLPQEVAGAMLQRVSGAQKPAGGEWWRE